MRLPFSMSHALTPCKKWNRCDHGSADGNLQTPNLRLEINYQCEPAEGEDRKRTICIQEETGNCDADVPEDYSPVNPARRRDYRPDTPGSGSGPREVPSGRDRSISSCSIRPLRLPRSSMSQGRSRISCGRSRCSRPMMPNMHTIRNGGTATGVRMSKRHS